MLWPKAEENDPAFAHFDFGQGNLVLDLVFAQQPARTQNIVFRVTSDYADGPRCLWGVDNWPGVLVTSKAELLVK